MMKPRTLVPFLTICSNAPTMEETIDDLRGELRRTQAQLTEESRKRAEAEAHVAILKRQHGKQPAIPYGDIDYGYECGADGCACELSSEYKFCPECGTEIDWRTWVNPDDDYSASAQRRKRYVSEWAENLMKDAR